MFIAKKISDLFTILCILFIFNYSHGSFIDYNENTELIQQRPGYDITLKCGLDGLLSQSQMKTIKVHWYFKQCRGDFFSTNNCQNFNENDWTQFPCEKNFCQPNLILRNVTENYSGLYKCTVYPYQVNERDTLDIKLVQTYQLDVKNTTIALPEFLGQPMNRTATIGDQVVFQCRVQSEVHPTIIWFKRISGQAVKLESPSIGFRQANNHRTIKYNGYTYELIPTPREKFISNGIYLNKLIINGVRIQDEGFYVCVAISYRGHRLKEAYLKVLSNQIDDDNSWTDYDEMDENVTDRKQFLLLFLMPLGLAMLPITVWLCYYSYKKYRSGSELHKIKQQYFNEDNITHHCMLRV